MQLDLSFEQLLDKNKFLNIKRNFLMRDYELDPLIESANIDTSKNHINTVIEKVKVHKGFIFGIEEEWYDSEFTFKRLDFYDDYLFPAISAMENKYISLFIKYLENHYIYETTAIRNFSSKTLKSLTKIQDKVDTLEYLDVNVKENIKLVIDSIYAFISSEYYIESLTIHEKFSFKLDKTKVILIFMFFYKNDLIRGNRNDVLGLIEQHFLFYDKSQKKYRDIKGAVKMYQKFKATNGFPIKAVEEIEKIFKDPNFFLEL